MAVDLDLAQLDGDRSDGEVKIAFEGPVRQHERLDRRNTAFDLGPVASKRRGRELVGDDLAILEHLIAGDMIVMPVAENDPDRAYAHCFERLPDKARMGQRNMRVVDKRFRAIDDRISADAQGIGAVVEPVRLV